MFITTWTAISVLPPPHMARRFGDSPFFHLPLLRDITQYIGHRILGLDRLSLFRHTESRYHLGLLKTSKVLSSSNFL